MKYAVILLILIAAELLYFRIARRFNIIDKPNLRSSHSKPVLRGGGIIFLIGVWVWSAFFGFPYPWFLAAVTLSAGISFIDDIHSLPDSARLLAQFAAMGLMFRELDILHPGMWWIVIIALVVSVGATNICNFMDGINGITGGYSLAVLVPLAIMNGRTAGHGTPSGEVQQSFLTVAILAVAVFCFFNFRPKNKARCFAGDVGSVGIAFILLFCIGRLILAMGDVTWLTFLVVYGIDGCLTIIHRIMLHENLGEAHRKHAYQIMANELGLSHVTVSLIYMGLQAAISLGMIYLIPDTVTAHCLYLIFIVVVLSAAYVMFMRKYYHLHEKYLEIIGK